MGLDFCRDCGHMIRDGELPEYEPACPKCGCLYPLDDAAEAAGELAKDKTAKRAGCLIAVVMALVLLGTVIVWAIYFR